MGRRDLDPTIRPEPIAVRPGDVFVLCSDGLYDPVADAEIRDVVGAAIPETACRKLMRMARERGGYDNITVAVVSIPKGGAGRKAAALQETHQYEVHG